MSITGKEQVQALQEDLKTLIERLQDLVPDSSDNQVIDVGLRLSTELIERLTNARASFLELITLDEKRGTSFDNQALVLVNAYIAVANEMYIQFSILDQVQNDQRVITKTELRKSFVCSETDDRLDELVDDLFRSLQADEDSRLFSDMRSEMGFEEAISVEIALSIIKEEGLGAELLNTTYDGTARKLVIDALQCVFLERSKKRISAQSQ